MKTKTSKTITEAEYLACLEFVFKADSAVKNGRFKIENRDITKITKRVLDTLEETTRKLDLLKEVFGYKHLFGKGGRAPIDSCGIGRIHDAFKNSYGQCGKKISRYTERDFLISEAARAQSGLNYAINADGDIIPRYELFA